MTENLDKVQRYLDRRNASKAPAMILSSGITTELLPCARITKYVISKSGRACFVPETWGCGPWSERICMCAIVLMLGAHK